MSIQRQEQKINWEECYGTSFITRQKTYVMACGGSHAWNYVIEFDDDGKQKQVYTSSFTDNFAMRPVDGFIITIDGTNIRLVDENYEPVDNECFLTLQPI